MPKPSEIDISRFAADITTKRGIMGLRAVAKDIGISAPTLSRIEKGNVPDLDTFMRTCRWLGKSPQHYTSMPKGNEPETTPKIIEAQLRADKTLPKETIDAISRMVELAYRAESTGRMPKA